MCKYFFLFLNLLFLPVKCSFFEISSDQERIIAFESNIIINKDASIIVTETIRVLVKGNILKHGILREFPTIYYDDFGNKYIVNFQILKILKNGNQSPYRIEALSNGKRIYIGSQKVLLKQGIYEYVIKYKTNRQIGFFKNYDEFYWNVTGNGSVLPIEKVKVSVSLPLPTSVLAKSKFDGYTGYLDSKEKKFEAKINGSNIIFETNQILNPYQGFTIAVSWDKGYIKEPNFLTKVKYFLNDNKNILWFISCIIFLCTYYLYVWFRTKKSNEIIIPHYEPPNGLTPGEIRSIKKTEYDNKILISELVNMSVQGFLKIKYSNYLYYLIKMKKPEEESNYLLIWNRLFDKNNELKLDKSNSNVINHVIEILKGNLEYKVKYKYFESNAKYMAFGALFSFIAISPLFFETNMLLLIFSLMIFISINILFSYLIKIYTKEGMAILAQIKGFKIFLSVTEKERLRFLYDNQRTIEEFEKFLPYAIALDVETKWCKQFKSIFNNLNKTGINYVPSWYIGNNFKNIDLLTMSLNSVVSNIISSSSIPPGFISSASNGSSGRGGGGGGVGGW